MKSKLENLISEEINPVLKEHLGSCELVKIEGNDAYIRLTGGCTGCPGRKQTFFGNIVPFLKEEVKELAVVHLVD